MKQFQYLALDDDNWPGFIDGSYILFYQNYHWIIANSESLNTNTYLYSVIYAVCSIYTTPFDPMDCNGYWLVGNQSDSLLIFNSECAIKPTQMPTIQPTINPSYEPSIIPTYHPTINPTIYPTVIPTVNPTFYPTINPTFYPTIYPSNMPSMSTYFPSAFPTESPTSSKATLNSFFDSMTSFVIIFISIAILLILIITLCFIRYRFVRKRKAIKIKEQMHRQRKKENRTIKMSLMVAAAKKEIKNEIVSGILSSISNESGLTSTQLYVDAVDQHSQIPMGISMNYIPSTTYSEVQLSKHMIMSNVNMDTIEEQMKDEEKELEPYHQSSMINDYEENENIKLQNKIFPQSEGMLYDIIFLLFLLCV